MARTWLIDSKAIARKVKSASQSTTYQIKDCGANRECPNCRYRIDNSDVSHEWPGLPAGVKFDPSDVELLEHLSAKCGMESPKPHTLIDEFIPTLEQGICYTHPENLPGAKKNGNSVHFFHRTINAYASGQRKRRKIQSEHGLTTEHVRWHKTGKTKPVIENGVLKGWKKIMVLYRSSKKGLKPDKSNWVMYQYHLGTEEDEKEGDYVVSKISYKQPKQTDTNDKSLVIEESDTLTIRTSPRTPATNIPDPPRKGKSVLYDDIAEDNMPLSFSQGADFIPKVSHATPSFSHYEESEYPAWLAGESQAVDNADPNGLDDILLCKEIFDSYAPYSNSGPNHFPSSSFPRNSDDVTGYNNACGIADLENLEFDTPPDFQLADLQFGSQDSVFDWLDRL